MPTSMSFRLLFVRLFCVVGLAASAASLADQAFDAPTYCSFDAGCEHVTASAYGRPLGIPLPVAGLVGFGAVLGLTVVGRGWAGTVAKWLAVLGGLVGVALIVIQVAVLGQVCKLCLVSDCAGIALALAAVVGRGPVGGPDVSVAARIGWPVAGAVAVVAPLVVALAGTETITAPPWVTEHWVEGKVTVVEVSDFECDHCKRADPVVREWLRRHPDVHFVRMATETTAHLESRPPALAFYAAQEQGRGEEMAEQLFAAPSHTAEECRKIATTLRLDMARYDRDVASQELDAKVARTMRNVRATGKGLPQIWVQGELIAHEPSFQELDAALARVKPPERGK
jgi:uncharacterized membrane protein